MSGDKICQNKSKSSNVSNETMSEGIPIILLKEETRQSRGRDV